MMSVHSYFYSSECSGKQVVQFCRDQCLEYNHSSFQWPANEAVNETDQNNAHEPVACYPTAIRELPELDQEEMLSWYQTVPLRHDPQDFDSSSTMQEIQLTRKGKKS